MVDEEFDSKIVIEVKIKEKKMKKEDFLENKGNYKCMSINLSSWQVNSCSREREARKWGLLAADREITHTHKHFKDSS